ncbi:hypothetical protein Tco_1135924 [Tanacetum coccineum]
MDETLYQAWERYNDILFRCPHHDLNNQQKVQIFYRGLDIPSRKMVDSQGPIPMMPPAQALKSIQDIAGHSHNSLNSLGCDMEKLNESIHAIQVGCKICEGKKSNKRQAAHDVWIREFRENIDLNLRILDAAIKNLEMKVEKLTQAILKNEDNMVNKVKEKMEKVKKSERWQSTLSYYDKGKKK